MVDIGPIVSYLHSQVPVRPTIPPNSHRYTSISNQDLSRIIHELWHMFQKQRELHAVVVERGRSRGKINNHLLPLGNPLTRVHSYLTTNINDKYSQVSLT